MAKKCGEKLPKKEKSFLVATSAEQLLRKKIIYANLLSRFSGFI